MSSKIIIILTESQWNTQRNWIFLYTTTCPVPYAVLLGRFVLLLLAHTHARLESMNMSMTLFMSNRQSYFFQLFCLADQENWLFHWFHFVRVNRFSQFSLRFLYIFLIIASSNLWQNAHKTRIKRSYLVFFMYEVSDSECGWMPLHFTQIMYRRASVNYLLWVWGACLSFIARHFEMLSVHFSLSYLHFVRCRKIKDSWIHCRSNKTII